MNKKIIYGDTVGTPMPRSDWAEKNERSAAYIKNKPTEEIKANTEARHNHINQDILDAITEDSLKPKYKQIVEFSALKHSGPLRSDRYTVFTTPIQRLVINSLLNMDSADTIPEYVCIFTSGDSPTRLSLPRYCIWANNDIPEIKSNSKYIIRIFDNIVTYAEVSL